MWMLNKTVGGSGGEAWIKNDMWMPTHVKGEYIMLLFLLVEHLQTSKLTSDLIQYNCL